MISRNLTLKLFSAAMTFTIGLTPMAKACTRDEDDAGFIFNKAVELFIFTRPSEIPKKFPDFDKNTILKAILQAGKELGIESEPAYADLKFCVGNGNLKIKAASNLFNIVIALKGKAYEESRKSQGPGWCDHATDAEQEILNRTVKIFREISKLKTSREDQNTLIQQALMDAGAELNINPVPAFADISGCTGNGDLKLKTATRLFDGIVKLSK